MLGKTCVSNPCSNVAVLASVTGYAVALHPAAPSSDFRIYCVLCELMASETAREFVQELLRYPPARPWGCHWRNPVFQRCAIVQKPCRKLRGNLRTLHRALFGFIGQGRDSSTLTFANRRPGQTRQPLVFSGCPACGLGLVCGPWRVVHLRLIPAARFTPCGLRRPVLSLLKQAAGSGVCRTGHAPPAPSGSHSPASSPTASHQGGECSSGRSCRRLAV